MYGGRCLVADIDAGRLARARAFGADVVINSRERPVAEVVVGELDGLCPSVVVDGAEVPALLAEAFRVAGPLRAGSVYCVSAEACAVSQQEIVRKELSLVGSRLNRRFIPEVARWLERGELKPRDMITHDFRGAGCTGRV